MKEGLDFDIGSVDFNCEPRSYKNRYAHILCKVAYVYAANLARKGDYKQAEKALLPVLKKNKSVILMGLYAKILTQQGKKEEACVIWQKALDLDPENKKIELALNKCKKLYNAESVKEAN